MKSSPQKSFALIAVIVTLIVILAIWYFFDLSNILLIWLIGWSITTFIFYGFDKAQAKRGGWRVPEIVLHGLAVIGGGVGAIAGMLAFRHKTKHTIFWIVGGASAVVQIFLLLRTL